MMISYAQNFEDVMLNRALGDVKDGFYVDVGAWDPNIETVTRHFYEKGWRGINIEPVPSYRPLLESCRPRDINLFVAAGGSNGRRLITVGSGSGMSSLVPGFGQDVPAAANFERHEVEVEVQALNFIFEKHAPRDVHFLKIDCEGSETDVINAFDLARFRPWLILVEAIDPVSRAPTHLEWEPHILSGDYKFTYFDGLNRFYVAAEHAALQQAFLVPPNILDDFRAPIFSPPPPPPGPSEPKRRSIFHRFLG